jgi:hypothetical protein
LRFASLEPVPPGEVKTKIVVRLLPVNGVVNEVHVGGGHDLTKAIVHPCRDLEVPVVEHGHAVEKDLEDEDGDGRGKAGAVKSHSRVEQTDFRTRVMTFSRLAGVGGQRFP